MAKKQTTAKIRKPTKSQTKSAPRRTSVPADTGALSVTDGAMKDVIRSAFLRRES
jgi:hypothetical protein